MSPGGSPDELPWLGVSRCLLGEAVRYDGTSKGSAPVLALIAGRFRVVPVCPEVEAGMPVPRPPIRLVRRGDGVHAQGVEDAGLDPTEALELQAGYRLAGLPALAGFILKSRSPSCGVTDTPVFDPQGEIPLEFGPGLFARRLMERFPGLPVVDEATIADAAGRERFLAAVRLTLETDSPTP